MCSSVGTLFLLLRGKMRAITVSALLLLYITAANGYPTEFACSRSMAVGEARPMAGVGSTATIPLTNDRSINTVGGQSCGGSLVTGTAHAIDMTLPSSAHRWLVEAKGVTSVFSSPFTGCSDRTWGNGVSARTVTFSSTGSVTMRLLTASGTNGNVGAGAECTFTVTDPAAATTAAATTAAATTAAATTAAAGAGGMSGSGMATCDAYCTDAVDSTCGLFGGSKDNCLLWCAQYETAGAMGFPNSTSDSTDTIGCRHYHWTNANTQGPAYHCDHASPGGGNVCGNYCQVYCGVQYAQTCPDNYDDTAACETACAGITVAPATAEIDDYALNLAAKATSGDSMQCRLYHLSVAGGALGAGQTAAVHCPHTLADATAGCVAPAVVETTAAATTAADAGGGDVTTPAPTSTTTPPGGAATTTAAGTTTAGTTAAGTNAADTNAPDTTAVGTTDAGTTAAAAGGEAATTTAPTGDGDVTTTAPTSTTISISTTLEGMTLNAFDAAAETTFKTEVARLMSGKTADDITITDKNEVARRRMLLAAGLKVDYDVGGFASEEEKLSAVAEVRDKEAEFVAALQADPKFSDLTGVSNDFGDIELPEPSAGTARAASWGVALVAVLPAWWRHSLRQYMTAHSAC